MQPSTEDLVFHEDYFGRRWTYGMTHRPPGIGCQPQGRIVGADAPNNRPDERAAFGTIQYPRELTQAEIEAYELLPITSTCEHKSRTVVSDALIANTVHLNDDGTRTTVGRNEVYDVLKVYKWTCNNEDCDLYYDGVFASELADEDKQIPAAAQSDLAQAHQLIQVAIDGILKGRPYHRLRPRDQRLIDGMRMARTIVAGMDRR